MEVGRRAATQIGAFWVAVAIAVTAFTNSGAQSGVKPYVVKIHADWCGVCAKLEPTWARIQGELGDRAEVLEFDVTNRDASERSRSEAERLGLEELYLDYRQSTGTVLVVDGKTKEVTAVLRAETDFSKYQEAVATASR